MPVAELLILRVSSPGPVRLDQLVLEALRAHDPDAGVSRGLLKKFLRQSLPFLDGKPISSPSMEIRGLHTVELSGWSDFLSRARRLCPAESCFLEILYEDHDLLILNKASGVPSVALSGDETHTASSAALAHVPSLAWIEGAKPLEPGLLNRLDTATSGILAFAKTAEEFARLRALWKTPAVKKTYRANVELASGARAPQPMSLREPIARLADSPGRMIVLGARARSGSFRGKPLPAVTHVRRVSRISDRSFELEIEIETGVMHQIRAHLSSQGWPIIGDPIYNPAARAASTTGRLMLHAWKLELPLRSGTVLELVSLS